MESVYYKRYAQFLQLYSGIADPVHGVPKVPKVKRTKRIFAKECLDVSLDFS
jgi:hypothetical protein